MMQLSVKLNFRPASRYIMFWYLELIAQFYEIVIPCLMILNVQYKH